MIKEIVVVLSVCMAFLGSCSKKDPILPVGPEETGALQLSVNMEKIGALKKAMKTASIEMEKLHITLDAYGYSTIHDTIELTGGSHERSVSKIYTGLVSWSDEQMIDWHLQVVAFDQNDRYIYSNDTMFQVEPLDTIEIAMFLEPQYSMLFANFYPIQDSVNRCVLTIDDDGYYYSDQVDSSFEKQTLLGDTVTLSYDYLTATPYGSSHRISMEVYGEINGLDSLLYSGDTLIIVKSGEDANYQIVLRGAGSNAVNGAATMVVTLGKIGNITFNGQLVNNDSGFTLTYDDNGSTGGSVPDKQYYSAASQVTVAGNPGALERTGFSFAGWTLIKNGVVKYLLPGDTFVIGKIGKYNVVLHANWTFTDTNGNCYHAVTLGNQTWMVENLKATSLNDGTPIQLVEDEYEWEYANTPAYCWYDNDSAANHNDYGVLYNWNTIKTGKLAPAGWHVATSEEWDTLVASLGGSYEAASKLREAGKIHWIDNYNATNETGFTALPGGNRYTYFQNKGYTGYWWTSTQNDNTSAMARIISDYNTYFSNINKNRGMSVRCVLD
ncbi:MAG: InlB B-repeat-containing protein [Chitinispirillaceae bacterium]|nr:InlB B-repeat-containing protein [Chitinispirillaceae bacterium]